MEERCKEVNDFNIAGKAKEMYSAIKSVKTNPREVQQSCIKDKNGIILDQRKNIMDRWKEYGTMSVHKQKSRSL